MSTIEEKSAEQLLRETQGKLREARLVIRSQKNQLRVAKGALNQVTEAPAGTPSLSMRRIAREGLKKVQKSAAWSEDPQ